MKRGVKQRLLCPRTLNSTAHPRCSLRECPVLPLRGGTKFLAHAAFPALRAHAAQNTNSQIGLSAGIRCGSHEGPDWAVHVARPIRLYFNSFCDCQGVFEFNAKIPHCTVHLGVTQQKLNGTQVARLLINLGDLCASH